MFRAAVLVSVLALVCADTSLDSVLEGTRDARLLFFPSALMGDSNSLFRSGLDKNADSLTRHSPLPLLELITTSLDTLLFLPTCERPVVKAVLDTCDLITDLPTSQEHKFCEDFVSEETKGFFTFPNAKADTCAFQINVPAGKSIKLTCKNVDSTTFDKFEVFKSVDTSANKLTGTEPSTGVREWATATNSVYIEFTGLATAKPVIECAWDSA